MYNYKTERPIVFTEEGQIYFLAVRDHIQECLKKAGAVSMGSAMSPPNSIGICDTWGMMACVDRLVELKEIREIKYGECTGQYRIFVKSTR